MKKRFAILFIASQVFAIPFTINFQMVVKDDSGRPVYFQNENITFRMKGTVADFWAETKSITTPNGIINTRLGSLVPIDPVSFFAQDSVRLTVTRANGDTILSEPFNAVPFAFRAAFADTAAKARDAVNAQMLEGKRAHEFLDTNYVTTMKKMISDSVWARGNPDPTNEIRDTANVIRGNARAWIGDTASLLRSHFQSVVNDTAISVRSDLKNYFNTLDYGFAFNFYTPGQNYDIDLPVKVPELAITTWMMIDIYCYHNQPGSEKCSNSLVNIYFDVLNGMVCRIVKTDGAFEIITSNSDPSTVTFSNTSNYSVWMNNDKLHFKAGSTFSNLYNAVYIRIRNSDGFSH